MPIFFERRSRDEDSAVLSIYGTKEDFAQLAVDLKDRLALQDVYRKPEANLRLPNLKSSSFDDVQFLVVSDEEASKLERSAHRRKTLVYVIWFVIVAAVICALLLTPK